MRATGSNRDAIDGFALDAPAHVAAGGGGAGRDADDLVLPIDCEPGKICWIVHYVDHDPGPGVARLRCGSITTDGQKGTDIAIRDLAVLARGVEVRAAAHGVVDALRDGMPDVSVEQSGRAAIAGRECGNGLRIAHGDGWTTWYCHLRRGSLMVQARATRSRSVSRSAWSACPARPAFPTSTSTSATAMR